tara:strand:+ start:1305 stop:1544 length:240 start_codon:yes stop_codon:yes gene_type:complete
MMRLTSKLVNQRQAADFFNVSEKTIQRWRNNQILKAGIHYRRKTPALTNSPYLYDLEKCEDKLNDVDRRDVRKLELAMA